jgi:hypothetical protein
VVDAGTETGELGLLVKPEIRALNEDDVPWLITLGRKRYGLDFDYFCTESWFRNIVMKQPVLFHPVRTSDAFCISTLSILPWTPARIECNVVFICCDDGAMWQGMHLLRASIEWGRSRKCALWRLSSDTAYDLAPMARRLGVEEITPRFELRY